MNTSPWDRVPRPEFRGPSGAGEPVLRCSLSLFGCWCLCKTSELVMPSGLARICGLSLPLEGTKTQRTQSARRTRSSLLGFFVSFVDFVVSVPDFSGVAVGEVARSSFRLVPALVWGGSGLFPRWPMKFQVVLLSLCPMDANRRDRQERREVLFGNPSCSSCASWLDVPRLGG